MNQDFPVHKKAIFVRKKIRAEGFSWKKIPAQAVSEKKKFVQRGSPEKKIPAQAVSEKIRASWKFQSTKSSTGTSISTKSLIPR